MLYVDIGLLQHNPVVWRPETLKKKMEQFFYYLSVFVAGMAIDYLILRPWRKKSAGKETPVKASVTMLVGGTPESENTIELSHHECGGGKVQMRRTSWYLGLECNKCHGSWGYVTDKFLRACYDALASKTPISLPGGSNWSAIELKKAEKEL